MEQYNDLFHRIDHNGDSLQFTKDELNQYFQSNHLNLPLTTEHVFDDPVFNEFNDILSVEQDNETVLSQKLNELSTKYENTDTTLISNNKRPSMTTITSTHSTTKKLKNNEVDTDTGDETETVHDDILWYLSLENDLFVDMTKNLVKSDGTLTVQHIQQVATLMHRIGMLRMKQDMYSIFLQSVKGTIVTRINNITDVDKRVWPIQVKSMMLTEHKSFTDSSMNIDRSFHPICENLLKRKLAEVDHAMELLEKELDYKRRTVSTLDSTLEKNIEHFVQQNGLKSFKIKNDFKIAIVKHEYEAEIVQRLLTKENLNSYQLDWMKSLMDMKREQEKSRQNLVEFKERIFYNRLSNFTFTNTLTMDDDKLVQYQRLDELKRQMQQIEQDFCMNHNLFDQTFAQILKHHRQAILPFALTTKQMNFILLRLKNATLRWKDIHQYRMDYYVRNAYDQLKDTRNRKRSTLNTDSLLSTLVIDTNVSLTKKQRQLLNRGPTYVPPCQMTISSAMKSSDDIIKQQFAPLIYQLNHLFTKYNIHSTVREEIHVKIFNQFNEYFRIPIPDDLQRRALYEKELIRSIQNSFKTNNLILRRTANQLNMFYLGERSTFDCQVDQYLSNCDLFEIISNPIDTSIHTYVQNRFNDMTQSIHHLLNDLASQRYLCDINNVDISPVYFLPTSSTLNNKDIQVVPFISTSHTAPWHLGLFLDQLLRPLINQVSESMNFHDDIDFLNKLNQYANEQQHFQSKTLFCTISIANFHAFDTHTGLMTMIEQFLECHVPSKKLQGIPIRTIQKLLNLFLQNNFFTYKDKIYRFVKGSPNTMPLTETLSNIYLFGWQKYLSDSIQGKQELFGRYKDQLFLTLNQFKDKDIRQCLQILKEKYPQIQFERLIGPCVIFMNTDIENRSGILYTRIHHSSSLDRYTLPYVNGDTKLAYSNWLRSVLFRAICSCSNVNDFQDERITLELSYLINGYSVSFVQNHVKHFFDHFTAGPMRYSMHQSSYETFRQQCFTYLESKRIPLQQHRSMDDSSESFHFYYIYEYGSKCEFNRQFYQLWSQYFDYHPILSQKTSSIHISAKDFHSLNDSLTQ